VLQGHAPLCRYVRCGSVARHQTAGTGYIQKRSIEMTSVLVQNTLRILALTTFMSAITTAVGFAEPAAKSKGNGAFMSVWGSDSTGCVWTHVYVSKTGTAAAPQTWMSYDVYDGCAGEWMAYGYGLVANTTFKSTNKTATLVLTPSSNANFVTQGATGSIKLTLTADGVSSYTYSGHSRSEYMGHVYQSHGSWTQKSATVTGKILGFAPGNVSGSFGTGRDRYMEIDRSSK
jgi:hypothetical protein